MQQQLYQTVILDHNRNPRNFGKPASSTHAAEGFNPLCGDHYHVFVDVGGDGAIVKAYFQGQGCAISKASASLMTEAVVGKTVADANTLFEQFRDLITGKITEEAAASKLGKLKIFSGVSKYPARVKCAALAWRAMHSALAGEGQVSTE